uniref:Reverse transcriptase domain, Reverse transcriptase zinc-binding domain protein n=1 Tax=Helianthus annuus TaxID=4232 RepID=A0A251SB85_HELAN
MGISAITRLLLSSVLVEYMAIILKCRAGSFLLGYLGLKVGANMNRIMNWKDVIDTFNKRLSSWKAKLLSFAGRLPLVKSVLGSLPNYYLSFYKALLKTLEGIRRKFLWGVCGSNKKLRWIKWEKVVASKKLGGLGVGGIKELNVTLLVKKWWRMKAEPDLLWVKVIKTLHFNSRNVSSFPLKKTNAGVWKEIMGMDKECAKLGDNVFGSLRNKVDMGDKTLFWCDNWVEGGALRDQFPLLYQLAADKRSLIQDCYIKLNRGLLWDWKWVRSPSEDGGDKECMELERRTGPRVLGQKQLLCFRDLAAAAVMASCYGFFWVVKVCVAFQKKKKKEKRKLEGKMYY